jgi:hypothetical protein
MCYALWFFIDKIYCNMGLEAPTGAELKEPKGNDQNALFQLMPFLRHIIAHSTLGQYPTPVHSCALKIADRSGRKMSRVLSVKREDLSSPFYGGNKVRALEYQVGLAEAKQPNAELPAVGSGGSNQVVATIVHGHVRRGLRVRALWSMPDEPEHDNTLNMLSVLSFMAGK